MFGSAISVLGVATWAQERELDADVSGTELTTGTGLEELSTHGDRSESAANARAAMQVAEAEGVSMPEWLEQLGQ